MEMRCPVCNDLLVDEVPGCDGCPVGKGCSMLCCSNCGYQTVPPRSSLVTLFKRLFGRKESHHES